MVGERVSFANKGPRPRVEQSCVSRKIPNGFDFYSLPLCKDARFFFARTHIARGELKSALERLIAAGLLFRQGVAPHANYLFKHAVQDAA